MELLKSFDRSPFANYDLVVYFGGGLFSIPFINRYIISPSGLSWPEFHIQVGSDVAGQIVSGLALLFSIYILGHILAYAASQFIEKLIDRIFGKISSSIIISAQASPEKRDGLIRSMIYKKVSCISSDKAVIPTAVRILLHFPVLPLYFFIYILGIFGYFNTRVPQKIMRSARARLRTLPECSEHISINSKWFKILEYCVINKSPNATVRMYNYLVIGGLFRTLCLIFLASIWFQIYYLVHYSFDGHWYPAAGLGMYGWKAMCIELLATALVYIFCLFAYIKFQRRYAEEAIFAFVMDPAISKSVAMPCPPSL